MGFRTAISIRRRLPLLICSLVLAVVIIFSCSSYLGVKKASIKAGQVRIKSLTAQLSSMFGQSSQNFLTMIRNAAGQDTIKKFLLSGGQLMESEASQELKKLHKDSSSLLVELLDANKIQLLKSAKAGVTIKSNSKSIIDQFSLKPDSARIGKLFLSGDSMIYPIAAAVTENKQIIGYVIRWRLLHATTKAIEQFSKLLGTNATLYIGNIDGTLWTDLFKPVPGPRMDTAALNNIFEFSDPESVNIMAASQFIPGSPWRVLVGFPQKTILEGSSSFLKSTVLLGGILIIIAAFAAWAMSQKITRPLKNLIAAASSIAEGDYSKAVPVGRKDEIGKLAIAFNAMSLKVQEAQAELEKKVNERTEQLQASNKELEAFSYSVSHDLRAPLRAINGFAMILKEEYGAKLDDEANRLTNKIISNAQMMGQLIDSLISFSQMGNTEISRSSVNMNKLASGCVDELLHREHIEKYQVQINPMPACQGDPALLKQVWMNLIENAIKYSSKTKRPVIEIGCTEGVETNIYYIKDNGAGFDMNYAHKLFGVFQRLHNQKDFAGTGIGLAFAKRIIQKHKGDIWAESKPGEGASFYFSLPALKEKDINKRKINLYEPSR